MFAVINLGNPEHGPAFTRRFSQAWPPTIPDVCCRHSNTNWQPTKKKVALRFFDNQKLLDLGCLNIGSKYDLHISDNLSLIVVGNNIAQRAL